MPDLEIGDDKTRHILGSETWYLPDPAFTLKVTDIGTTPVDVHLLSVQSPEKTHTLARDETYTRGFPEDGPDRDYDWVRVTIQPEAGRYRIQAIEGMPSPENEPPVADFLYSPSTLEPGEEIDITNQSSDPDGSIVSNHWDWGDGTENTALEPTHSYDEEGTYTITLTVTDDEGATDSVSHTVEVSPPTNEPPNADFTFSPSNPVVGEDVDFTNQSSDPDGSIIRYYWNFGLGESSAAENPTHSWDEPGDYDIELEVTDNDGAADERFKTITVEEAPNEPPNAAFTFSPSHASPYEDVKFTDKSSDPDGSIMRYNWDFGDGNSSTAKSPTHSYEEEDTYNVSLKVTDNDGATDTYTRGVTIAAETNVTPPEGGENTGGGNVQDGSSIGTETEEDGSWKGIDNLVPDFSGVEFERFDLGWSCPIGLGPFSIDICAIVAAPIEIVVNIVLDLIEFVSTDLLGVIVNWALGLARDSIDAILTFPPPLEQLSDYAVNWIIYGEDEAQTDLTAELKGVVTDWTKEYVSEVLPSEQDIENYVTSELDQFAEEMGLNPEATQDSLTALITNQIQALNLDPDQLAQQTLDELIAQHPELAQLLAPETVEEASFIYRITPEWYREHGYAPEGKPLTVHVSAHLYSTFFNGAAWTDPKTLPDNWNDMLTHPYEHRSGIYDALDINIEQFDLKPYQEELFMERSFRQLYNTATAMASGVIAWLETSVEEFQPTWQEIVTELSDLLQPPVENILEDEGFIVPPSIQEQEATVPEALDALQQISTFLDNIDAVTPDQLESLDDDTEALIDKLQQLTGGSEGGGG